MNGQPPWETTADVPLLPAFCALCSSFLFCLRLIKVSVAQMAGVSGVPRCGHESSLEGNWRESGLQVELEAPSRGRGHPFPSSACLPSGGGVGGVGSDHSPVLGDLSCLHSASGPRSESWSEAELGYGQLSRVFLPPRHPSQRPSGVLSFCRCREAKGEALQKNVRWRTWIPRVTCHGSCGFWSGAAQTTAGLGQRALS